MPRAAVIVAEGEPLDVQEIAVDEPRAGELKLRMAASGVCHSDLSAINGTMPQGTGIILGHEGAGVVQAVGADVTGFAEGDHVALSWVPQCGACFFCERGQQHLCEVGGPVAGAGTMLDGGLRATGPDGRGLRQMLSLGTFAEEAVVPTASAVRIDADVDLRAVALIGCGVLTGVGAALRTATIREGDTAAVVGCGGVGLNVIQGARMAGASQIIAIDREPAKLEIARTFGATHGLQPADDTVDAVKDLTAGRGADAAFEVVGLPATTELSIAVTRAGGEVVLVGVSAPDAMLTMPLFRGFVRYARTIKGCFYGSADVNADVPFLLDAYRDGRLKLDELISREFGIDGINDALDAMGSGDVARSLIVY